MSILNRILKYFIWSQVSMILAILYMRIVIGPKPESTSRLEEVLDWMHYYIILYVGSIVGAIVAFLYIIIDIFYLEGKLKNNPKRTLIRFCTVVALTFVVGVSHYLLEKVIDVI